MTRININGTNINITPELEAFVESKVDKLHRYLPNIREIQVDLTEINSSRGPDIVSAQITVRHDRGAILRTEEKRDKTDNGTVKAALQEAVQKMYRRIRRFKDKPRSKRMKERYVATLEEINTAEVLPDEVGIAEEVEAAYDENHRQELENTTPFIMRRKQVEISAMNEDEAVQQMELLGHNFFIFYNEDANAINVVYKRVGGGYGLIEPQIDTHTAS